ncbi:MAG: hypothetical protein WC453_00555 [Patescibacteria group bacterium]
MPENQAIYLRWPVPEYKKHDRSRNWYIITAVLAVLLLFFSFFSFSGWRLVFLGLNSNFLFALIIVLSAIVMIINDSQKPTQVGFELGPEGVKIGRNFYDYDEFKNFSVLYKPKDSIKNLYLEYKNSMRPRLSVPLRRMDALTVRNFLVRYLDEDLDRTVPPLSEQLTKLLKL